MSAPVTRKQSVTQVLKDVDGSLSLSSDSPEPTVVSGAVYFIDASVPDIELLIAGLPDDAEVVLLQPDSDGVQQMADYLANREALDAIHILSHGGEGALYVGNSALNADNLASYQTALAQIGQALSDTGDILLYGCNVGASAAGESFVSELAAITGADVAASNDVTGLGGNWELEVQAGSIESQVALSSAVQQAYGYSLATFDWTGASVAGNTVSQTVAGVTITGTSSVGWSTASGGGGFSGDFIFTHSGANTITFSFSQAVDLTSIWVLDSDSDTNAWVFTPFGGSNSTITVPHIPDSTFGNSAWNIALPWSGITSFTVSESGDNFWPAFDTFAFTVTPTSTITSASYNASNGALVVTGTNFEASAGAANDVIANKITLTGEGGATYTLTDTANVELTSATEFTLNLSATDQAALNQIFNKNGSSSTSGTTYDVDGAAGFIAANVAADTGVNGVTVSNVAVPTISSATYDYSSGVLTVTGSGFLKKSGATNDIDVSKLTLTGEGGASYTLSTSTNVEISSGTSFSLTLTGADLYNVAALLNKNGTSAASGATFNLAAAEDWAAGADAALIVADLTGNAITVSNYTEPTISSASYDLNTGVLTLTGSGFVSMAGAANDIVANKLTMTGEGGNSYTLTNTANVDISSATSASLTLSAVDALEVASLWNQNGTSSATSGTTYNLSAAEDWMAGAPAANVIADATTAVTVSNYATPSISSATYDYSSHTLVVTGTRFVKATGAGNDIDLSKLSITGEGGSSYTLTGANVEIDSATQFTVTLSSADIPYVNALLNKNGTSAVSTTTYNLAAAEDWMAGAPAANTIADTTANGITVSNYVTPSISGASYDWSTGQLQLAGSHFVSASGANNDIDVSKLTLTGEGGQSYTLTSSSVDISSATTATINLNAVDQLHVRGLFNANGGSSDGATTYNLSAAEDWMAGAPLANTIADVSNAVTVSNVAAPTITSATYDYGSNSLVVTATNLAKYPGADNDIDASKLTITGEGGASHTLASSSNVEILSATSFSITLSGADIPAVEALLNSNGTTSATSTTTFNLAAADNWLRGSAASSDIADATNAITVSNYSVPAVTSVAYDWSTGQLVLTGSNFVAAAGANNDIDVSKLSITGEAGNSYTLTSSSVDITSATSAIVSLNEEDQLNIRGLLNKNGTLSADNSTYNLVLAEDWMSGSPASATIVDASNPITTTNVALPTISSASYDTSTGVLVVTGTNLFKRAGADNDIDLTKLTFFGGTAQTYTLTSTSQVDISSATSFSLTLSGADKVSVDALLDQVGTSSSGASTYDLRAADGWLTAANSGVSIADQGNAITVSIAPQITSAIYDVATGVLTVTGTNIQANGSGADIDASTITLTGEGGEVYTLTDTPDVNRDSLSQFSLALSATDREAINQILNKNGANATDGTSFNLAIADNWNTQYSGGGTANDTVSLQVNNVAVPAITSANYDVSTGLLSVTGTGFLKSAGSANDIDISKLTLTGEGGATYTLTSSHVDISSSTAFSLTLNDADRAALNQIMNKNGSSATSGTAYNLAAAEDWAAGADVGLNIEDLNGNAITVSNVPVPSITSATYTTQGTLVVTGSNFLKRDGLANDIDVSKLTFTGQGGATYTLTDSADVEISSATSFTVVLSNTDKAGVNALLNKAGTSANDNTSYNLAAAEDWAVGADAGIVVADTTGNGITVTLYTPPSSGGSSTPSNGTTQTVDGVQVNTTINNGTQTITFSVQSNRVDDPNSATSGADIPVVQNTNNNGNQVMVSLPTGTGLSASGPQTALSASGALTTLTASINNVSGSGAGAAGLIANATSFLGSVGAGSLVDVRTLTITSTSTAASVGSPIIIGGNSAGTGAGGGSVMNTEALVIDTRQLPSGHALQLNNIEFAVLIGATQVSGGVGNNFVVGDDSSQYIVLGEGDDVLYGGGGDDTVGSEGGNDRLFGQAGNDTLFGGEGADMMHGGTDSDVVTYTGNLADYEIIQLNGVITITRLADRSDSDTLINIERVDFADSSFTPEYGLGLQAVATLYQQVFNRQADVGGFQWWTQSLDQGRSLGSIALEFLGSAEYGNQAGVSFANLDHDQQLDHLYLALLGRSADSEGKAFWLAQANAGVSIELIASAFVASSELSGQYLASQQWDFLV